MENKITTVNEPEPGIYEMRLRVLGNEVFAIGFKTSDNSNRAVLLGTVAVFSFLTITLAFGDKIVEFYKYLTI